MARTLTALCILGILLIDLACVLTGKAQLPRTVLIGDLSIAFGAYVIGLTSK